MIRISTLTLAAVALIAAAATSANAATIYTEDWETGTDGWSGPQAAQIFNFTGFINSTFPAGPTAWFANAADHHTIGATGANVAANTTYTLSVDVGDRGDTPFPGYSIQLVVGATNDTDGTVLASETTFVIPDNEYLTRTIRFSTGAADAEIGQALQIRLVGGGLQALYDNIILDASAVPEPASLALLGLGGLVMLRRR